MYLTREICAYADAHISELKQLIRDMSVIPAPSGHEEKRAAFCKDWFEKNGFENVYIDEALNVIAPYGVTDTNEVVAFTAHTDVVFPDTDPLPFREDEENFYCPGVGDDTANLAVLMIAARYFVQNKIPAKYGMLFVANSCEEGLGNLKGIRALVKAYGSRMAEHISFDGTTLNGVLDNAVGSHRYRVTVRTEGGHSFSAFGNRNAIRYLSSIIDAIYTIQVPKKEGSKTTYNVGTICGGTSVNTIAQEATMLCEYRSSDKDCLEKMQDAFTAIFAAYNAMGVEVEAELVGERPCKGAVNEEKMDALLARMDALTGEITDLPPCHRTSSTDCNIPLSLGIPSTCIGVVSSFGAHTREERLCIASLPAGLRRAMGAMAYYFA